MVVVSFNLRKADALENEIHLMLLLPACLVLWFCLEKTLSNLVYRLVNIVFLKRNTFLLPCSSQSI